MTRRSAGAKRLLLAVACTLPAVACAGFTRLSHPLVESRLHALAPGALAMVSVVPFYPRPDLERSSETGSVSAAVAADLVTRFMVEALVAGGVPVTHPGDLVIAFEGEGLVLPRQDAAAVVHLAARDFGASSVLLGEVVRYREREGGEFGARHPASVWFEVTLYSAPAGERLFSARFEQIQPSLSADPLVVRQYPGGGTRWLAAGELARWGADLVVADMRKSLE